MMHSTTHCYKRIQCSGLDEDARHCGMETLNWLCLWRHTHPRDCLLYIFIECGTSLSILNCWWSCRLNHMLALCNIYCLGYCKGRWYRLTNCRQRRTLLDGSNRLTCGCKRTHDPNGTSPPVVAIPICTVDEDGNLPIRDQPLVEGIVFIAISPK